MGKSKCKLAIYTKVDWTTDKLPLTSGMIKRAALQDMRLDALDLADVLSDQVRRLVGAHGRTKKAIAIFGHIGQQTQVSEFSGSDVPLDARLRRSRKRRTLSMLAVQALGSFAETVLTWTAQSIGSCIRWSWNTVTANYLILAILCLSIIANLVYSSRSTSEWWHDRKAINFMSRLGVGTDHTMAKAIYVQDLQEATTLDLSSSTADPPHSVCRDTFNSIMNLSSKPSSPPMAASTEKPHSASSLRLQNTRQHLSVRRHDLLVAIRVVNSIEREMVKAEWENWLVEENARCELLGRLLEKNDTEVLREKSEVVQKVVGKPEEREMGKVRQWHERYCGSCREEVRSVMEL